MLVRFQKKEPAAAADQLTCVRPDGSATGFAMVRQAILPHEAFHFVLETTLAWHDAFFGRIARGLTIETATALLHDQRTQASPITQGLHAEALVVCLQAEQWAGGADPAEFARKLIAQCRRFGVSPPDITPDELERVRRALREFGAAWRPLPPGGNLERTFGT